MVRRDGARDVNQVAADLRQVKGVGDSLLAGGAVGAEDGHRGTNVDVSLGGALGEVGERATVQRQCAAVPVDVGARRSRIAREGRVKNSGVTRSANVEASSLG